MEEPNHPGGQIKFSIIIPVQRINDYIYETCGKLRAMPQRNFEVIIYPDVLDPNHDEQERQLGARIIPSGKVSPAVKRDLALEHANGQYLAFTDDDAYPDAHWLEIAEKYLQDGKVAAVGGPQLTPPHDSFWQKVSGAMFMSPLSGKAIIRYWPGKQVQEVDDWPTVNFIIKKDDFAAIGGFDNAFWPGEDTKLCLDIIKTLKKKILYVPQLVVFHHRRSGLKKHIKQVGNYGIHRGYFAKVFPDTSIKFDRLYFVPSVFTVYVVVGLLLSLYFPIIMKLYLAGLALYGLALLYSTFSLIGKTKSVMISLMTIPYLVLFHFFYGARFMQGFFFTKQLNSKLGK